MYGQRSLFKLQYDISVPGVITHFKKIRLSLKSTLHRPNFRLRSDKNLIDIEG